MRSPKSKIKVDVRSILRERVPAGPAGRPRLSLSHKMDQTATLILDLGALICCSFFCLEPPMGALIVILFLVLGLSFFVFFWWPDLDASRSEFFLRRSFHSLF